MKDYRTTILGLAGAATILATAKGWIDKDIAAFIAAVVLVLFGASAKDAAKK